MAKKISALVRLQIPTSRPDAGPAETHALGRRGVDMTAFSRVFQSRKPDDGRTAVPVVITVYEDRSFALVIDPPRCQASHEPSLAG
jgi:ribosomal protein L11